MAISPDVPRVLRPVEMQRTADGSLILRSPEALAAFPSRYTQHLEHWAATAGERVFLAERNASGSWRTLTYRAALDNVRKVAQSLLERGLSAERPILILSGSDLEHAILALAALHVGIPYTPLSTGYSLLATDFARLHHAVDLLTPGLVFAASGTIFGRAIEAAIPKTAELIVTSDPPERRATHFAEIAAASVTAAVDEAASRVRGDTIAKFLFTSGSTSMPKAVINTHRMLCANQQMAEQLWPCLTEPQTLVSWMPWNHAFGGNFIFGAALSSGGRLYIDSGTPTPAGIGKTLLNLAEVAPTSYWSVPLGYQMLLPRLEQDRTFRQHFFSRVQLLFYAGAGMPAKLWESLQRLAFETRSEEILFATALGSTETATLAIGTNRNARRPDNLGLPVPGVEAKLVPNGFKQELRLRGVTITPGYWRQPELTAKAFDAEGWYCMGDAVRLAAPDDPGQGLLFDGRVSDDFKLSTGSWVNAGPLRTLANSHLSPLAQDVIITGLNRDEIGMLVFPEIAQCRMLTSLPEETARAEILRHPAVCREFQQRLENLAALGTAASNRIQRAILMIDPPSGAETTDKGALSQGTVLQRRAADIDELYAAAPSQRVLIAVRTHYRAGFA